MEKDFEQRMIELHNMKKDIGTQILELPDQVICSYWEDKKVHSVAINLDRNEHITVCFEKGYVIVRTENETKFVCKGNLFISLWR